VLFEPTAVFLFFLLLGTSSPSPSTKPPSDSYSSTSFPRPLLGILTSGGQLANAMRSRGRDCYEQPAQRLGGRSPGNAGCGPTHLIQGEPARRSVQGTSRAQGAASPIPSFDPDVAHRLPIVFLSVAQNRATDSATGDSICRRRAEVGSKSIAVQLTRNHNYSYLTPAPSNPRTFPSGHPLSQTNLVRIPSKLRSYNTIHSSGPDNNNKPPHPSAFIPRMHRQHI
jgi:hypothetical protein